MKEPESGDVFSWFVESYDVRDDRFFMICRALLSIRKGCDCEFIVIIICDRKTGKKSHSNSYFLFTYSGLY